MHIRHVLSYTKRQHIYHGVKFEEKKVIDIYKFVNK